MLLFTRKFSGKKGYNKILVELNKELPNNESWLVAKRLKLNVSKTHSYCRAVIDQMCLFWLNIDCDDVTISSYFTLSF